jgi:hypothetical protein
MLPPSARWIRPADFPRQISSLENPPGIPVLYMSTDREKEVKAMTGLKPWICRVRGINLSPISLHTRTFCFVAAMLLFSHVSAEVILKPKPNFILTKGQGAEVCEAYLKRLNLTNFQNWPYCDRPENTEVEGFARLNRVSLSAEQAHGLLGHVLSFTSYGNQDAYWSQTRDSLSLKSVENDLKHGVTRVWLYDPPVDIDNDGQADAVIVWHGYGASHGVYSCGSLDKADYVTPQVQIAYSIDLEKLRVDEARTRELFGHPKGVYPDIRKGKQMGIFPGFRPVGKSIGIFQYRDRYYFDTFFDSWGDFEGRRRQDKHIDQALGVFLRQGGKTRQVCEYRWTNPVLKY